MSRTRFYTGCAFLVLAILIWIPSGDVIDLIIRQKEIVLGRYSRGHFGALFFLTLLLLGMSALCFSKIKTVGEMILVGVMVFISTLVSGFVVIVGSGLVNNPRYVVTDAVVNDEGVETAGAIQRRPAHEIFNVVQDDKPEQKRSYPDSPPGYPAFNVTMTTDKYGFRNQTELNHYPIVAVGDSFVASSHVSDDQAWVNLLAKQLGTGIYNLGVSGTDPGIYYNNFVSMGKKFQPKLVLFMFYEGNDFKGITPIVGDTVKRNNKSLLDQIAYLASASPVTKGLQRLSSERLEVIGRDNPVPGYRETVGWMPLKIPTPTGDQYYGFEPKRLTYLYEEKDEFSVSKSWQSIRQIMEKLVAMGEKEGFTVLFLYAPSTPHVVMPLVRDAIPADQLRNFATYQKKDLPAADVFKKKLFEDMGNEQDVFMQECQSHQWHCLPLTRALQDATARGQQVYYSYDQHWTPDGNRVVAGELANYLKSFRMQ